VDGSVRVVNTFSRGKKVHKGKSVMTIFRLDFNRGNGTMRMIENLAPLPPSYQSRHGMASTVAWDPSIAITTIKWNLNKNKQTWLASAMACGLVRIDKVPLPGKDPM
jgi:hypothetical protein